MTEILEKIPARLKVIRHIRPKLSCRCCERIVQVPMPDLPIEKGRPGPGLVASVVSKYLDGLPLYRQSAILAREGIEIERATLADWVGHAAWWVTPLAELIGAHVLAAPIIHTDDTPIAVLAPGNGKTRTGRLWTYVVDERPWQGGRASAADYRFSPDRRGERPRDHLALFRGVIQADAFSGYQALTRPTSVKDRIGRGPPPLIHAACWAHARRKFYDVFEATKSPIAEEALKRIGELYKIEAEITGQLAEARLAARQCRAVAILNALCDWLTAQRRRLSAKNPLAKAIQYALSRWKHSATMPVMAGLRSTIMSPSGHCAVSPLHAKIFVPWIRRRRRARRNPLHRAGKRQTQRPRSASLAQRRDRSHGQQSPDQPAQRTAAVELAVQIATLAA